MSLDFSLGAQLLSQERDKSLMNGLSALERSSVRAAGLLAEISSTDRVTLSRALHGCVQQQNCSRSALFWNHMSLAGNRLSALTDMLVTSLPLTFAGVAIKKALPEILAWMGAMGEIEAYVALAKFYRANKNDLFFAQVEESASPILDIRDGHLPYLKFINDLSSIANGAYFSEGSGPKTAIYTGPNAFGKTMHMRMILTNLILAEAGAPVPAHMRFSPMGAFTNFVNTRDSTTKGLSTFQVQSQRIAEFQAIIREYVSARRHLFVGMDEILLGTSDYEKWAGERAVYEELHTSPEILGGLATHNRKLTELAGQTTKIALRQVLPGFHVEPGTSKIFNAFEVMGQMGVGDSILTRGRAHLESLRATGECLKFGEGAQNEPDSCASKPAGEEVTVVLWMQDDPQSSGTVLNRLEFDKALRAWNTLGVGKIRGVFVDFGRRDAVVNYLREKLLASDRVSNLIIATHGDTDVTRNMTTFKELGEFGAEGLTGLLNDAFQFLGPHLTESVHVSAMSCATACGTKAQVQARVHGLKNALAQYGVRRLSFWGASAPLSVNDDFKAETREERVKKISFIQMVMDPNVGLYTNVDNKGFLVVIDEGGPKTFAVDQGTPNALRATRESCAGLLEVP